MKRLRLILVLAILLVGVWLKEVILVSDQVKRVIDGDTVEMSLGEKVRYIGINTPESVDPRRPVQCFGKEASEFNKRLVEGRAVYLESDVEDKDKYGRWLRYVYLDDPTVATAARMVNEILVREGYASVYTFPPNVKYQERFLAVEAEARKEKRGLWGSCPVGSGKI